MAKFLFIFLGASRETLVEQISNVMGLKAIKHGNIQGQNICSKNNGECSHFCFYRHNKTHVCACPIDYDLHNDKKRCNKSGEYFLYSSNDTIKRLNVENGNAVDLPIKGIKHVRYEHIILSMSNTLKTYFLTLSITLLKFMIHLNQKIFLF